jgi:hypothetical protein
MPTQPYATSLLVLALVVLSAIALLIVQENFRTK